MKRALNLWILAGVVAGLCLASLTVFRGSALISSVWPVNAVILAATMRGSRRPRDRAVMLAVAGLSVVVAQLLGGRPLERALGFALADIVEICVAIRLIGGASLPVRQPGAYVRLIIGCIFLGPAASTLLSSAVLWASGDRASLPLDALNWFLSDAVGMGVFAPLLMTMTFAWAELKRANPDRWGLAASLALVLAASVAVFAQSACPLLFLIGPCIVAAVFCGGKAGGASAVALTAAVAAIATAGGHGPIVVAARSPQLRDFLLQGFLAAQVLTVPPISLALQRLRDAEAEQRAAAAAKAEFLANMSHELRTPLTSIIGYAGLAASLPDLEAPASEYIARVRNASQALLSLVSDVLDFSKLEVGQISFHPKPTQLAELCRSTLELFAPQAGAKDLHLELDLDPAADRPVMVDPDRLRQVLLNLVGNAVKFTDAGRVRLAVRHDAAQGALRVEVHDTGAGVPADKLERLFQRFSQVDASSTRSKGGAGLGLAICKGLIEGMGGRIGVDSVVGHGSRFWFELPAPSCAEVEPETGPAPVGPIEGARVLLVDDHPTNRQLACMFLTGAAAKVSEAGDGLEAVQAADRRSFDVIVMDVHMPRMDGPEALATLRAGSGPNRATPILAFTAHAEAGEIERLKALGFHDVVSKPVEPRALIEAVAAARVDLAGPPEAVRRRL